MEFEDKEDKSEEQQQKEGQQQHMGGLGEGMSVEAKKEIKEKMVDWPGPSFTLTTVKTTTIKLPSEEDFGAKNKGEEPFSGVAKEEVSNETSMEDQESSKEDSDRGSGGKMSTSIEKKSFEDFAKAERESLQKEEKTSKDENKDSWEDSTKATEEPNADATVSSADYFDFGTGRDKGNIEEAAANRGTLILN